MLHMLKSVSYALTGIRDILLQERNFRIHWLAGVFMLSFNSVVRLAPWEHAILLLMIFFVMTLELINSAIERLCDVTGLTFDHNKKHAKDFAAAAVLLFSTAAVVTFGFIVEQNFSLIQTSVLKTPLTWTLIVVMLILNTPLCFSQKIVTNHSLAFVANLVAMFGFMAGEQERPAFLVGVLLFQLTMGVALATRVSLVKMKKA